MATKGRHFLQHGRIPPAPDVLPPGPGAPRNTSNNKGTKAHIIGLPSLSSSPNPLTSCAEPSASRAKTEIEAAGSAPSSPKEIMRYKSALRRGQARGLGEMARVRAHRLGSRRALRRRSRDPEIAQRLRLPPWRRGGRGRPEPRARGNLREPSPPRLPPRRARLLLGRPFRRGERLGQGPALHVQRRGVPRQGLPNRYGALRARVPNGLRHLGQRARGHFPYARPRRPLRRPHLARADRPQDQIFRHPPRPLLGDEEALGRNVPAREELRECLRVPRPLLRQVERHRRSRSAAFSVPSPARDHGSLLPRPRARRLQDLRPLGRHPSGLGPQGLPHRRPGRLGPFAQALLRVRSRVSTRRSTSRRSTREAD